MKPEVSSLNSKDLLKILPSYLIEEVGNINQDPYILPAHSSNTPKTENIHKVRKKFFLYRKFFNPLFI